MDYQFQKNGYFPYNNVTPEQTLEMLKKVYNTSDFIISLPTLGAWNRILGLIYEFKGLRDIHFDSATWGNYLNAEFEISKGQYSEDYGKTYTTVTGVYKKETDKRTLLTTGATTRNCVKNIFDLAGNINEMIEPNNEGNEVLTTGGSFTNKSYVSESNTFIGYYIGYGYGYGFRMTLYLQ